jgi:hypothetical protein
MFSDNSIAIRVHSLLISLPSFENITCKATIKPKSFQDKAETNPKFENQTNRILNVTYCFTESSL